MSVSPPTFVNLTPTHKVQTKTQRFITRWTGFRSLTVLLLCIATVGLFSLFSAFQLSFLRPNGSFDVPLTSGERFWYLETGRGRIDNQVHLWSVVPAGTLLPLQFIPIIRRKFPRLHRWSGYFLSTLLLLGSLSGMRQGVHAFGGTVQTQIYTTLIGTGCILGTFKSITAARRYHFDRHRIWALRTWSYATSILTLRLILVPLCFYYNKTQLSLPTIAYTNTQSTLSCAEILYLRSSLSAQTSSSLKSFPNATISHLYPSCLPLVTSLSLPFDTLTFIRDGITQNNASYQHPSSLSSEDGVEQGIDWNYLLNMDITVTVQNRMRFPEEQTVFFRSVFGWCGLAGLVVNVVLVEGWILGTSEEGRRLRVLGEGRRKMIEKRKGKDEGVVVSE